MDACKAAEPHPDTTRLEPPDINGAGPGVGDGPSDTECPSAAATAVRSADPTIREIVATLPAARRRSRVGRGLALFVACEALYLLTFAGIYVPNVWVVGLSLVLNGVAAAMLFLVGHDACHGSLTPVRWVNRLIGRLAFLASFHFFSSWAKSHNTKHHGYTNLKGFDPGYPPFTKEEFDGLPWWRRTLERVYRTVWGLGLSYFIELWWKDQAFPSPQDAPPNRAEFQRDRLLVLAYAVGWSAVAYGTAVWTDKPWPAAFAAMAVLAPWAVFNWLMGFVTLQQHTHPDIPWFDDREEWNFFRAHVAGTTHVRLPKIVEPFFLNIFEHNAHHVDPLTPLYELPESQQALDDAYPDDIRQVRTSPLSLWRTMRCCKLYDYRRHEWLDFRGRVTSKTHLPAVAAERSRVTP